MGDCGVYMQADALRRIKDILTLFDEGKLNLADTYQLLLPEIEHEQRRVPVWVDVANPALVFVGSLGFYSAGYPWTGFTTGCFLIYVYLMWRYSQ